MQCSVILVQSKRSTENHVYIITQIGSIVGEFGSILKDSRSSGYWLHLLNCLIILSLEALCSNPRDFNLALDYTNVILFWDEEPIGLFLI